MGSKIIKCSDCNIVLNESVTKCPNCGSTNRNIQISVSETISAHEMIGLKAKRNGVEKPIKEAISGDELFRKLNKWVHKERVFDRENDRYHELVKDKETGEIIHECNEPLSKHIGHGSDKKRNNK